MKENAKKLLDNFSHPYVFYGFAFSTVLLHYFFTNALTGTLYFVFMVILTIFFLSALLSIFMMKSDPAVIHKFSEEEKKAIAQHKNFKRVAGVAMLYLFVAFNWIVSFTVWAGIMVCLLVHSNILKKHTTEAK